MNPNVSNYVYGNAAWTSNVTSQPVEEQCFTVGSVVMPRDAAMTSSEYLPYENMDESSSDYSLEPDAVNQNSALSQGRNDPVKLKGPIAFAGDSDTDKIPISKEGRAQCEYCGAIGVRHSFYTKERRYCSRVCSNQAKMKGAHLGSSQALNVSSTLVKNADKKVFLPKNNDSPDVIAQEALQQAIINRPIAEKNAMVMYEPPKIHILDESREYPDEEFRTGPFTFDLKGTYDWADGIGDEGFIAAPVSCFKHAPLSNIWEKISLGMKIEVPCYAHESVDEGIDEQDESYWIATVVRIQGYLAMVRYVGMPDPPDDPSVMTAGDFWVHLCSDEMKPVGWCAQRSKVLIPPPFIVNRVKDWKEYLVQHLTGAKTLLKNFGDERRERISSRFQPGHRLEVIDREKISQIRVATVHDMYGGRLHLRYQGLGEEDPGTWAHETSPNIKPVGWALKHLHDMEISREYLERIRYGLNDPRDAPENHFTDEPGSEDEDGPPDGVRDFLPGDKLECVDPLNANVIGSATVERVLPGRYLMIQMDWYLEEERARDAFCRHASSKYIFPCGFCQTNQIPLKPPVGCDEDCFSWKDYLEKTGLQAAPIALFQRKTYPHHGFEEGMRLECVDATDPRLICAATIVNVVQRLLRIHFDGWDEEYDMWIDCDSADIFPLGFCTLIGYPLQSPREGYEQKRKRVSGKRGRRRKGQPMSKTTINVQRSVRGVETVRGTSEPKEDSKSRSSREIVETVPREKEPEEKKIDSVLNFKEETQENEQPPQLTSAHEWTIAQVCQFLAQSDCGQFSQQFIEQASVSTMSEKIDGSRFLQLTINDLVKMTNKMGPALKISKLIEDINFKLNPALSRSRQSNANRNRI